MARKVKKQTKNATVAAVAPQKKDGGKRALIVFVSIFVGVVLLAGIIAAAAIGITNASYLAVYENVGLSRGVANYFVGYFKTDYLSMFKGSSDTATFWSTMRYQDETEDGYTFGEDMVNYVTAQVKELLVQCALFDEYSSLTRDDKELIEESVNEVLNFRAGGSVATFNENAAKYGFNFNDFKTATTMIYKAALAVYKVCGANGSNMAADNETAKAACEDYYNSSYAHAFMLFVRTDSKLVTDADGNRVKEDGEDKLQKLTDEEKLQRQQAIAEIEEAIAAINEGRTDPEYFFDLMKKYDDGFDSSYEHYADGYYFASSSAYTESFPIKDVFSHVVAIDINEATKVEYDDGVCFILRAPLAERAYTETDEKWCFSDFYELVANDFYGSMLKEKVKSVTVRPTFTETDFVGMPYITNEYVARFGG